MSKSLCTRAVDVGYGHIKYADGRDEHNAIRCDSFPSQSPAGRAGALGGGVMHSRDTFLVEVNGKSFEVGKAVALAGQSNRESEVLDQEFSLSDAYAARLYGALSYMAPSLKDHVIDLLVLGLPLNTFTRHETALKKIFTGEHKVNSRGTVVNIRECHVYPQPLGAYMAFLHEHKKKGNTKTQPTALVVDPGYNTVDWFLCKGMAASEERCGAALRGMSAFLRAVAEAIIRDTGADATPTEVVRRLDESFGTATPFTMYGQAIDLAKYLPAGAAVIDEAANAIKNSVGSGSDVDVIVVAGGGAKLYVEAIRAKFPRHEVVALANPAFANVRGFQIIGEKLAQSSNRASATHG